MKVDVEKQEPEKNDFSKLTEEQLAEMVKTNPVVKSFFEKERDRAVTTGIKTFEEKTLPAKVQAELDKKLKELNPEEKPEQRELREMKERLVKLELAKTTAENKSDAVRIFNAEKLPEDLLDVLDYADSEKMNAQIEKIKTTYKGTLSKQVEEQVAKKTGRSPVNPDLKLDNPLGYNPFDKQTYNMTAILQLETENPELAKALEKSAKK